MVYFILILILLLLSTCLYMYYYFMQKLNALRKQNVTLLMQNKQLKVKINKAKEELRNIRSSSI